jgi:MFS family permease
VTTETWLRLVAALSAVAVAGGRARERLVAAGLLSGFAAFGWGPRPVPGPLAAGLSVLVLAALAAVALLGRPLPITGDGALAGALFGVPAAAVAAVAIRGQGAAAGVSAAAVALAAVSLVSAESVRSAAGSGGRRTALFASALILPAALAAAVAALAGPAPPRRWAPVFAAAGLGALAWVAAIHAERGRVRKELEEEVRLGFLPAEDAEALELPWRRALEKRFGRPDERREYVRSALLLAIARAQQRGLTGEAGRLRHLEVLTFRTRLRRTLEARALRHRRFDSGEFPAPSGTGGGDGG